MLIYVDLINKRKQFEAIFYDGTKVKFGQINPKIGTYIDHRDNKLRTNYIKRQLRDLNTNNYTRAGYLSLFLLWNNENLKDSIHDFNQRIKNVNWKRNSS